MFLSPSLYSTKKVSISRLTSTQYSHIHRRVAESRLSRLLLVRTWLRAARTIEESMWKWNMGTWRHSILWWVFKLSTFIQISSACWSRRRVLSPIQHIFELHATRLTNDTRQPNQCLANQRNKKKTFHPKSSSNTRNENEWSSTSNSPVHIIYLGASVNTIQWMKTMAGEFWIEKFFI